MEPDQTDPSPDLTAGAWVELSGAFEEAAKTVLTDPRIDTDVVRLEGVRYLTRLFGVGALMNLEVHDPAYPQFVQLVSPWLQWALPNPDCFYQYAPLDGRYRYRISGQQGTPRLFHVEVMGGDVANLSAIHVFSGRSEFTLGPDGEIDIVLSQEESRGNWIPLPPGECFVVVRQYFYDWESEVPANLVIEREGAEYPAPPVTSTHLSDRLQLLIGFLQTAPRMLMLAVNQHYAADPETVPFPPITMGTDRDHSDQLGLRGLYYGQGHYRCEPDQAVIFEVAPPPCRYWSFQLGSHFWEAYDWHLRQSSLNGHQAVVDADGVFRAVIAHRDPGVPNWLDVAGHTTGLVAGRYFETDSVPIPRLRVVPFDKVRELLPDETAVVGPAERREILRRRMLSVRKRWIG